MTDQTEVKVETPDTEGFTPAPLENSIDGTGGLNTDMFTKPFQMLATVEAYINVVHTKDGQQQIVNSAIERENVVFDVPMGIVNQKTLQALMNTGTHKAIERLKSTGVPEGFSLVPDRAVILSLAPLGPQTAEEFKA